jgi:hypothetical protein
MNRHLMKVSHSAVMKVRAHSPKIFHSN